MRIRSTSLALSLTLALALAGELRAATDRTVPPAAAAGEGSSRTVSPELRGDILVARKMYREAIDAYRQVAPASAMILNKTGIAFHQLGELKLAKTYYERAVKLKPDYAEAINNIGTIDYAHKSYRKAISIYKKALVYEPESASIEMNLGTAYFARKNYDLAFASYQEALRLDPEVFEHRGVTGTLLQERSVEDRAKFHFYLARVYAKAGDFERCLQYLRKALEEGFRETDQINKDPEFTALRENEEFKRLMASERKVL